MSAKQRAQLESGLRVWELPTLCCLDLALHRLACTMAAASPRQGCSAAAFGLEASAVRAVRGSGHYKWYGGFI